MRGPTPRMIEHAVRQDEAEAELRDLHADRRRLELRAAALLARIEGSYHFVYRGCSSIAQYGEMLGLSGREARTLAAVGRAVELKPELSDLVVAGKISLDAAAALGKVFDNPDLVRDGDDWLAWAEQWSAKRLEREVAKRMREAESGEPVSTMTALLTSSGREKFERARQLACRKKNRLLSEGQTIEVLADHYLDSFDPERRQPRERRAPDTSGRPGRSVPREVERAVVGRQGDTCAVPGCDHSIWMNKAHVRAHRHGGSREAGNLLYLCREHHVLFDLGLLRVAGTAERPTFHGAGEVARAPP